MTITDMAVLVQKVHDLPKIVNEEAMVCLLRNAQLFQGLAQVYVHVDKGNLRDSIQINVVSDGDAIKQVDVVAGGSTAPYAAIIEAKYPFMTPAWEQVKPALEEELRAIQERINSHVNK